MIWGCWVYGINRPAAGGIDFDGKYKGYPVGVRYGRMIKNDNNDNFWVISPDGQSLTSCDKNGKVINENIYKRTPENAF